MSEVARMMDVSVLSKAFQNRIEVSETMAEELALRVMNYFGYGDSIIDNMLNQEDRRLFYFLQDLGFLQTHWDETLLPATGKAWRIFYWRLNISNIMEYARVQEEEEQEEVGVYDALPDKVWSREGGYEST